ncbi:MAG: ABC transporter permease [Chloroflexi bacterium]|nr:MAG: ABC transporter permease [Chloroflexota bacterium]
MALAPGVANPQEYVGDTVAREWRRLRRNRLALVATVFIGFVLLVAIISVFWTPYPIYRESVAPTYEGLSSQHLLGADQAGRDILSRLAVGAQISLEVGVGTQILVVAFGILVGLTAGYYRGILDGVISTVINIFYGIPSLLVALLMVLLLGRGLDKIIIAIAATSWMDMARLVRGQGLALREREFVEAARAGGAKASRIIFRHILPNALGPIIVQATFGVPAAILFEAFLSFLGLGVQPRAPSWGSMAADGIQALRLAPHIVLAPALALSLTLMAFNFLGDGLRDALDPRQKR